MGARILTGAGVAFVAAAAVIALGGGFQVPVGPWRISASSPARVLLEGAILLLLGELAAKARRTVRLAACVAVLLVAAAWDSETRRVGDGFEYLAMARNLARVQAPSLSAADFVELEREANAHGDSSWRQAPMPSLQAADARFDFPHFWMYSLAAAPLVAGSTAAGLHPAAGFTMLNVALVTAGVWLLLRRGAAVAAVLFAAILLWWIDKVHADIFIAALTVLALQLRERTPLVSLWLLGVAAAQMPVLMVLLVAWTASTYWAATGAVPGGHARASRRVLPGAAMAFALAALHPVYYLWRLGVVSPLGDTVSRHVPGVRAIVTPLVDPNLGILWFAPALSVLTVVGAVAAGRGRQWRELGPLLVGAAALLVAASQTPNVNHGGTPGMSRYGIWLLAVLSPLALRGELVAARRCPRLLTAAAALSVVCAAIVFHPRLGDAGVTPSPTALARVLWTRLPAIDNPLPEVFAERIGHTDGDAVVPVATERCEKALVVGTGGEVRWPEVCAPRPAPDACRAAGALCYANGTGFSSAPRQPAFRPSTSTSSSSAGRQR
ncbi:MAG: hypothetical protein HY657_03835 [Acidobacteria bacterium]|nr:hypothetical protein [Acidobacteriota bacterium]